MLRARWRTFALHDVGGAVEVGGGVPGAGDAVVLSELPLVRARRTADAAVCAGVVVMSRRALDCRSHPRVSHVSRVVCTSGGSERAFSKGIYYFLTFGFTLLEGHGTDALGHQVSAAGEAGGPTDLWLIRSQWTQQTGHEAIVGVLTR